MAGTALVVVAAATACSGDDQGRSGGETASPREAASPSGDLAPAPDAGSTADALRLEEAAVTTAHRAAMDARIESAAPPAPRPDLPALAETHVDPFLAEWTGRLQGMASQGLAIRYPADSELTVDVLDIRFSWEDVDGGVSVEEAGPTDVGNVATLEVCIIDDGAVVDDAGAVTRGGGVYTIHETAVLHKVDGTWRLAQRSVNDEWSGTAGCAAG